MNNLNIIPTPQYVKATKVLDDTPLCEGINSYYFDGKPLPILKNALALLPSAERSISNDCPLTLSLHPNESDKVWFCNENADEQGYIIRGNAEEQITIIAKTQIGLAYGISTLLQLPNLIGEFEIKDYPDFRYRANKWLLWAETEVWSYDFGDGIDAFRARIIKKLDLCLKYKINMIFFDAWGADTERAPHYKELMRECNRAARERGIHLIFGAYTMGYGLSGHSFGKHFGKIHKTRRSYPDGEIYECLGTMRRSRKKNNGEPFVIAREFGGCLSNDALMEEKLEELTNFVREIEPGALYLHNMDSHLIHQTLWLARCDECRKKWPSDDILTKDGMAGAFAYYFDRLNSRLKEVRTDTYDADRDLIIFNISPGYTEYHIDDGEAYAAFEFWKKVREYSDVKNNVYPLFREQYYNKETDTLRLDDITLDYGIIAFCGGDGFYSDDLFPTTALFHKAMLGAKVMITCSGNAFAEPLQLFNSEYMWNSQNSALYNDKMPIGYKEFTPLYEKARLGGYRKDEIFDDGGVIDLICKKLYGDDAEVMSQFFRLRGENGECPAPYPCNRELETHGSKAVFPFCWDSEWDSASREAYTKKLSQILSVSKLGCAILSDGKGEDAKAYHKLLTLNLPILSFLYEYVLIYGDIEAYFTDGGDSSVLLEKIRLLSDKLKSEKIEFLNSGYTFADLLCGALARRSEIIENLIFNLDLMKRSITLKKRIPEDYTKQNGGAWW